MICGAALLLSACMANGSQAGNADHEDRPSLVLSDEPLPEVVYRPQSRDGSLVTEAAPAPEQTGNTYKSHVETLVSRKVTELETQLGGIQGEVSAFNSRLQGLQRESEAMTAEYYSTVATINADLQSGTTPGNPDLVEDWNEAQDKLGRLADSSKSLDDLANDLSAEATKASYLLDATQATFGLSGAVKEDHKNLTVLEDQVNQTIVLINRLLNTTQDEINRRTNYLRTEKLNLQTLSLAIANGEFYGQSISNRLFKRAADNGEGMSSLAPAAGGARLAPAGRRPLVVIRFDRPNVNYEQAVYSAVGQALEKYPQASFDLVSVSPTKGNPAEVSMAGNSARKNGEAVLRTLTQMGLPTGRIHLNEAKSGNVNGSEVHIFIE